MNRLELRYALKQLESRYKRGDTSVLPDLEAARAAYEKAKQEVVKMNAPAYAPLTLPNVNDEIKAAYDYLCSGITYTSLYNSLVRGFRPVLSKKILGELHHCKVACKHFTQKEFDQVNPHKLALLVWRLIQSGEGDDASYAALANVIDRTPNRKTPPLIHHQPDVMEHSWLVEAFNNRNNPEYDAKIIEGAKAIDTDLNKMKLFIHDIELLPRRLNLILGLHHIRTNKSFPTSALRPFFNAMYEWGFDKQIPTFLSAAMVLTPGETVPNDALNIAIRAASENGHTDGAAAMVNYMRVMNDIPQDSIVQMPAEPALAYAIALQEASVNKTGGFCVNPDDEPNVIVDDLVARGEIKPLVCEKTENLFSVKGDAFKTDLSDFIEKDKIVLGFVRIINIIASAAIQADKAVQKPIEVKIAGYKTLAKFYAERRIWKPTEVVNNCSQEDATSLIGDVKLPIDYDITLPPINADPTVELTNLLVAMDKMQAKPATIWDSQNPILDPETYEEYKAYLPVEMQNDFLINEVVDTLAARLGLGEVANPDKIDPITQKFVTELLTGFGFEFDIDERRGVFTIPKDSINAYVNSIKQKLYKEQVAQENASKDA